MTPLAKKLIVMIAILLVVYASMRLFDLGGDEEVAAIAFIH